MCDTCPTHLLLFVCKLMVFPVLRLPLIPSHTFVYMCTINLPAPFVIAISRTAQECEAIAF